MNSLNQDNPDAKKIHKMALASFYLGAICLLLTAGEISLLIQNDKTEDMFFLLLLSVCGLVLISIPGFSLGIAAWSRKRRQPEGESTVFVAGAIGMNCIGLFGILAFGCMFLMTEITVFSNLF